MMRSEFHFFMFRLGFYETHFFFLLVLLEVLIGSEILNVIYWFLRSRPLEGCLIVTSGVPNRPNSTTDAVMPATNLQVCKILNTFFFL